MNCHLVGVAVFPSRCIDVISFCRCIEPQVLLWYICALDQRTIVYFTCEVLVLEMYHAVHVTALMEKKCPYSREVLFQSVNMWLHHFLQGPHIASVTLAAYECGSVNFPEPPYPAQIMCPEEEALQESISLWTIMSKVRLEACMWVSVFTAQSFR